MKKKKRLFKNKYRVDTIRFPNWDYKRPAYYFITICSQNRVKYFGKLYNNEMHLSNIGKIAEKCWLKIPDHFPFVSLDEFCIMPEHIHGIIKINKTSFNIIFTKNKFGPQSKNIGSIIRGFKCGVTIQSRKYNKKFKWQTGYYDHIIRDDNHLNNTRNYIKKNKFKHSR